MPTELRKLHRNEFLGMYMLACDLEPFGYAVSPDDYVSRMSRQDGWTIWDRDTDKLIGFVTLSNLIPLHDVLMHAAVDRGYHGLWLTRGHLRKIFGYVFGDLELRRVSGFSIMWKTYAAGNFLTRLGFQVEGVTRSGIMSPDGKFYDLVHYGMLREECRWVVT